jgi:hypothetical protein
MKKILIVICGIMLFSCSTTNKNNLNDSIKQTKIDRQVLDFDEIPTDYLRNLDKMGVDASLTLNDYEQKYLNYIFRIDTNEFNLVGKKVGFLGSKRDFFKDEREWINRGNKSGVAGCGLYILNTNQKIESGGYDAAIVYWRKIAIPVEKVIKRLKNKKQI